MKKILLILLVVSFHTQAIEKTMDEKLDDLTIESHEIPGFVSENKLFSIHSRYSTLNNRHEVNFIGGNNFTPDSHIESTQLALGYRYHLNAKWSAALKHTKYYNKLSPAGKSLLENENFAVPSTDYAISATDLSVAYNTVYGKLRINDNNIIYFDHYVSLGFGKIELESGDTNLAIFDTGLAFWIGKNWSSKLGLRNEFYKQIDKFETKNALNSVGYVEFGYLFGGQTL